MSGDFNREESLSRLSIKSFRQFARKTFGRSKSNKQITKSGRLDNSVIASLHDSGKALSSDNPRFKSLRKMRKTMSRSTASQPSIISKDSSELFQSGVGLSADQQVQLALQAKKKANRKNGEVLVGPSVAMMAKHKQKIKANNQSRVFSRFLPKSAFGGRLKSGRITSKSSDAGSRKQSLRTPFEVNLIVTALKGLVLFNQLSASTLENLAQCMEVKTFGPDQIVCKQGDFGDELFVVSKGELCVINDKAEDVGESKSTINNENSITLKSGNAFGELGMHYGSPRERTITSLTPVSLFVLRRNDFGRIVENEYRRRNELMFEALGKVKILDKLKTEQLKSMMQYCELVTFPAGSTIIEKGSLGGTFYMIVKGTVECIVFEQDKKKDMRQFSAIVGDGTKVGELIGDFKRDVSIAATDAGSTGPEEKTSVRAKYTRKTYDYGPGQYFGERALIQNDFVRKADVLAKTDVELLAITYESLSEHLNGLIHAFEENIRRQALEDAPFFDNLDKKESEQLQEALKVQSFKDGQHIIKEGKRNDSFFIIRDGEVEVKKSLDAGVDNNVDVATLKVENYFGEGSLLSDNLPNASVIAKGSVTCYVLSRKDFKRFIKDEKINMLQTTFNERNRTVILLEREKKNQLLAAVSLQDVKMLRTLGSGCFGLVKLVEIANTDSFYALKILEKGAVVRNNQELNVMNEKKILLEADHPFIVKLYRTFKDERLLYYLMEFIQGGEMFQFLHHERNGSLDNTTAKFFISCVVDALDYLHKKRIVYRDLKPENLMIDNDGYAKIVDFGFAKRLLYKTFTLCGTAQYLAPEILFNKGYGRSVDFWCLGILIFELFTGTTPFKRTNRNELFRAIKTENRVKFASRKWRNADDAKQLVCLLLHKHPKKRLGCSATGVHRGFKEVKNHTWFDSIDFKKLYFKELTPPWKPRIKSPMDATHFETYDEEDNPITGKYDDRAGTSEMWADF